jgi:glycosyltransferase involved in cell wall biosynthesis
MTMRILILAQVLPYPPDSGPKVKTYGSVRALAALHDVTVLAFSRSDAEDRCARQLAAQCGCTVHTVPLRRGRRHDLLAAGYALLTGQSFILARDRRRAMHQMVHRLLNAQPYDVIHVDQLNMAQYVPKRFGGQVVFDAHNAVWTITERMAAHEKNLLRRIALHVEARRIRCAERHICEKADIVLTTTMEDQTALLATSRKRFWGEIIPIGVDVPAEPRNRGTAPLLIHIGTMFYPPNADAVRWFVTEVFDRVRAAVPDARFVVVGARPPADIAAFHDPARGIEVRGYVPDIAPLLAEAAATVVPTRAGSGMRVKILEAMAVGLPIVTTTVGAEGIRVVPDTHLLIADDAAAFADATVRLLSDPALRARLRNQAHALAAARYDWHVTGTMLCSLYSGLDSALGAAPRSVADRPVPSAAPGG